MVKMSTSWKSLSKQYKTKHATKPSLTAQAAGVEQVDYDVNHLCDVLVVNDLKEEYYYTDNENARDAFEAHQKILKRSVSEYVEIISTMRPIMLECQKIIAALYLFRIAGYRQLAFDLLGEVRPTWRLTFFKAMKQAPAYANIKQGWNRTLRTAVKQLIANTQPYSIMKYAGKLHPVVAAAHLKENTKTRWLFNRNSRKGKAYLRRTAEFSAYFDLVDLVKNQPRERNVGMDEIANMVVQARLPYTIALGILGGLSKDRLIAKALLTTMTPWETILGLRKLSNAGIDFSDPEIVNIIVNKLRPEKLQQMKIDPIELMQAYNQVTDQTIRFQLKQLINTQIHAIGESIKAKVGNQKVAVVFDCSGSMGKVAEWSMMLAYAIGATIPNASFIAFSSEAYTLPVVASQDLLEQIAALREGRVQGMTLAYGYGAPEYAGTSYGFRLQYGTARYVSLWGGTSLGAGLMAALQTQPDIIFFISDFEGNTEPYSDAVYRDYKARYGKFPQLFSIKATSSPWTAAGEYEAMKRERWLGIPEEYAFTIRNLWDLPTILEYIYNLLPLIQKRKKEQTATYV